jgi:hypothetical protein
MEEIEKLRAEVARLKQENEALKQNALILAENQEKALKSRAKLKSSFEVIVRDLQAFQELMLVILLIYREIEPLQKDFEAFSIKYQIDKIDLKGDSNKKDSIGLARWAVINSTKFPSIAKDIKNILAKVEGMAENGNFGVGVEKMGTALNRVCKYLVPNLSEDELKWFKEKYPSVIEFQSNEQLKLNGHDNSRD